MASSRQLTSGYYSLGTPYILGYYVAESVAVVAEYPLMLRGHDFRSLETCIKTVLSDIKSDF